jgi:hypothetical protein
MRNKSIKGNWIAAALAIFTGLAGGLFGAFLSATYPALSSSTTIVASEPLSPVTGTSILLLDKANAHASVMVDRNGLIVLNLTTRNGRKQIALGVFGDSKLEVGIFDSIGKARAAVEVPMLDAGRVHMLLLDKDEAGRGDCFGRQDGCPGA